MAGGARRSNAPDQRQNQVFGRNARGADSREMRFEIPWLRQYEALRREYMFDFAGSEPQRERAEGAVRRRMRITAHDQHSGLRRAKLGGDHVYDALIRRRKIEQLDPELPCIDTERVELARGDGIIDGQGAIAGRNVVIDRRQRALRAPYRAAGRSQACERLR